MMSRSWVGAGLAIALALGGCWSAAAPPPVAVHVVQPVVMHTPPLVILDPATRARVAAAERAARAQLADAEAAYAAWDAFQITEVPTSLPQLAAQVKQLDDAKLAIEAKLAALEPLGTEYAMAAKVLYGDVEFDEGLKLGAMPQPPFRTSVQVPFPSIPSATAEAKRAWVEVVEGARRAGIANRWSRLALDNLVREFPGEYAVFHQELVEGTDAP